MSADGQGEGKIPQGRDEGAAAEDLEENLYKGKGKRKEGNALVYLGILGVTTLNEVS